MFRIMGEFTLGFDMMNALDTPAVTVFGSARIGRDEPIYAQAEALGRALALAGFVVITGGGPGTMEAANKGAFEAGGVSVGLNIELSHEQKANAYQTKSMSFEHFYARKVMLVKYSTGFVVMPGGFGTLDELAECLTLIQTRKVHPFPVFLVGTAYWQGLLDWLRSEPARLGLIAPDDLELFKIVDDVQAIPAEVRRYHDAEQPDDFKRP